jgi:hypothetical protein
VLKGAAGVHGLMLPPVADEEDTVVGSEVMEEGVEQGRGRRVRLSTPAFR